MQADPREPQSIPHSAGARWLIAGSVLIGVLAVMLVGAGPGTDLDVANVFRSGRSIVLHGDYLPSRAPGAIVHETAVGLADRAAGPIATNLVSVVAAIVLVIGLDRLLAGEGIGRRRHPIIALIVANPWFLIAATSTVDFVPALMFVVLSALALRRGRPVWAGLAAAAAIGCRIGSGLLIASIVLAEITGEPPGDRDEDPTPGTARTTGAAAATGTAAPWRSVLLAGGITAIGTIVLFTPSFLHAGGLAFAENDFRSAGPLVHVGRSASKNLMVLGPIATLIALTALPAIGRAIGTWRTSWPIRFALPAFVLSQLLFLRFPWKMGHLLPALLTGAILLGIALRDRPGRLVAIIALQLVYGFVSLEVIEPDDPNRATGGHLTLTVDEGPVLRDLRCRRDHPDPQRGRQKIEVEAIWNCAQPFGRPDDPG